MVLCITPPNCRSISKTLQGESCHYDDVIMGAMASQITSLTIFYSTVYSGADQRKHQSPASLAFVQGIHRGPVNSPHKWPVTRKMFPFDEVIMVKSSLKSDPIPSLAILKFFGNGQKWLHLSTVVYFVVLCAPTKNVRPIYDILKRLFHNQGAQLHFRVL